MRNSLLSELVRRYLMGPRSDNGMGFIYLKNSKENCRPFLVDESP